MNQREFNQDNKGPLLPSVVCEILTKKAPNAHVIWRVSSSTPETSQLGQRALRIPDKSCFTPNFPENNFTCLGEVISTDLSTGTPPATGLGSTSGDAIIDMDC